MIGRVVIPIHGHGEITVTLNDKGELNFRGYDFPEARELIGVKFELYKSHYGPWRGPFGVEFLNDLASKYQGKAEIVRRPGDGKEHIY